MGALGDKDTEKQQLAERLSNLMMEKEQLEAKANGRIRALEEEVASLNAQYQSQQAEVWPSKHVHYCKCVL